MQPVMAARSASRLRNVCTAAGIAPTTRRWISFHVKRRHGISWAHQGRPKNIFQKSRGMTTYSTPTDRFKAAILKAREDSPVLFPTLLLGCIGALSVLGLLAYDEYTRVAPNYAAYPPAVETRLRIALHFTHVQPEPDTATTYFVDAIKAAEECGMNPFGKEYMGIRIRYAEMLEKFGRVKAAVEVLRTIASDCEEKLADVARGAYFRTSDNPAESQAAPTAEQVKYFQMALRKAIVQTKAKMAAMYESDYVQNPKLAKSTLSDAVDLLVKATNNPAEAFSEENAAGLTMEEVAALLSQMGDLYATTGEESNAVQVYLLALEPLRKACNGSRSCKEVQIFSNIASTMDLAMKKPGAQINGKPATRESLAAGRKAAIAWADQAIATAAAVEDPSEICDTALLSAQTTRADLLLEGGDKMQAKISFEKLLPSLRERGLTGLVRTVEDGLKRAG